MSQKTLLTRRQQAMGPAYRLFYDNPVHLVRGEGVWLFDADGRRYLDMYNNVPHVGHCHPRVIDAICDQARQLNTHTRYLHENSVRLAERLTAKMPAALDTVMFCCTGSEANDLALRIAQRATGGTGVVVVNSAYHGTTAATCEISTDTISPCERPPWVATALAPDPYRNPFDEDTAYHYADYVADAIYDLEARQIKPAAFIIDTIASSSGVVAPPPGYLREAAKIVREAGMLFIADEVQPGFGRTGKHFWGFEADDFVPDIVTLGKPMGNGHPISAVIARRELVDAFAERDHYFNTFGGNPVSCAAGLAVLDVVEEEGLQQNALDVGQHLVDGLWRLADKHECIGDVRGTGLFLAVDLVTDRDSKRGATDLAARVVNELRERGVLTGSIGPSGSILKLRSPLVLSKDDADYFLGALGEVLP